MDKRIAKRRIYFASIITSIYSDNHSLIPVIQQTNLNIDVENESQMQ